MDLSDSDDDLFPSINSINAMFTDVHQKARQASVPKPLTNSKPSGSKKNNSHTETKTGKSVSSKGKAVGSSVKKSVDIDISDDTKSLLAEVQKITKQPGASRTTISVPVPTTITQTTNNIKSEQPSKSKAPRKTATAKSKSRQKKKKTVQEIIELSDDDDADTSLGPLNFTFDSSSNFNQSDILDVEPVEDELVLLIVHWKQESLRFRVPRNTKMSSIRMEIAQKVSVRADSLVILDDNSEEVADNTSAGSVPFGKALEAFERESIDKSVNTTVKNLDPNCVIVKLQGCGGYRERCSIVIKKTTHVKQLVEDFIEKFGFHGKKFKLVFDGEDVDLTETPDTLDLENNDMLDVVEI